MRFLIVCCGCLVIAAEALAREPANAFVEVDYATLERSLAKEPKYVAAPRYALFLLDAPARFRVWAVLDKSKPNLPHYDVLYFDRNGNGDLTEPGERFVGRYDEERKELLIRVGDLAIPGTNLTHTDLRFLTVESHGYKGVWFAMKWGGQTPVEGGCGEDGDLTTYSPAAGQAPVLRPTPFGPLSFKCWQPRLTLTIGKTTDVQLGLGNPGSGPDTFCAVSEHYLVAGKDVIVATLIARERDGKELRTRTEIKQHC